MTTAVSLAESVSRLLENQGRILELLSRELKGLSEKQRADLLALADENFEHLRQLEMARKARGGMES